MYTPYKMPKKKSGFGRFKNAFKKTAKAAKKAAKKAGAVAGTVGEAVGEIILRSNISEGASQNLGQPKVW